ncbi:MAG TPA: hypothetical protein PLC82_12645 [Smithellaceae bacterium]|nr:hypothetical protein [Smithellaceae bacterium]HQN71502.1 hypothetical protein [Smithella sp.]
MTLRRKKSFGLLMLLIVLALIALAHQGQSAENCNRPEWCQITFSPQIKSSKIAVLPFFPMSPDHLAPRHERVFTNEFYSSKPTDAVFSGWFSPANYLEMIRDGFRSIAFHHQLPILVLDQIGSVPRDADYIVLGMVHEYEAGSMAAVSFDVRLLKGKTFEAIGNKSFSRSIKINDLPLIINYPIHMIGNHAIDYHPQRTALNLSTYLTILDILLWMDQGGQ